VIGRSLLQLPQLFRRFDRFFHHSGWICALVKKTKSQLFDSFEKQLILNKKNMFAP
jgi:hypothetical protein